jgi:hypothetical protein
MAVAAESLVRVLVDDPRVRRAFVEWKEDHRRQGHFQDWLSFKAAMAEHRDRDLARLDRLVSEDLGLPYEWLGWLLLADFGLTIIGEATNNPKSHFSLQPDVTGLPPGRAPRAGGRDIARDVEWYYRVEIKVPRETTYEIGKEYASRPGIHLRKKSQDSTVDGGIQNAKKLLAAFAVDRTQGLSRDTDLAK